MNASFVIVNYNRKEEVLITIGKTKELIKDYRGNYEIVIVDNGSTDGSAAAVSAAFPDVVLITKKVNIGAPAWNEGFTTAKGDYLIILDDDSHIETGLEEALYYMDQRPKIGVLALNILTGPYTSKNWEMREGENIIGFIGCGAILRKETFQKIGGYAEWIFLYGNEWEYGMRCLKYGYEVRFFENCKVIHRTSPLHRTSKRFDVLVTKHELGVIYKYFYKRKWLYIFRCLANVIKGALRNGQFKKAMYTLSGLSEFMKLRTQLKRTPVTLEDQQLYIKAFPPLRIPVFNFITKHINGKAS
jgi:GT2 family glycosyltransferase